MPEEQPNERVDESIPVYDHESTETESANPTEESRGVIEAGVETVASVFRASFIILGAVALVVTVFIGVAMFTTVDLAMLGDTIVASGAGFLATPFLTMAFMVASALVLVIVVHFKRQLSGNRQLPQVDVTPEPWEVVATQFMSVFSCMSGGFGGAMVCGRVGGANPIWESCGLVISLVIFWEVVSLSRSRGSEPTTIPVLRKLTARDAVANVLGAVLGGLVLIQAPNWFDF